MLLSGFRCCCLQASGGGVFGGGHVGAERGESEMEQGDLQEVAARCAAAAVVVSRKTLLAPSLAPSSSFSHSPLILAVLLLSAVALLLSPSAYPLLAEFGSCI